MFKNNSFIAFSFKAAPVIILLLLLFLLAGCKNTAPAEEEKGKEIKEQVTEEPSPETETISVSDIKVDGEIKEGEYPFSLEDGSTGIKLSWASDVDYLYLGMEANTSGWLAIGFDPEFAMKGANIIFMAIAEGEPEVRDDFGNSNFSHSPDEELGGTNDIKKFAGSQTDEGVVFEIVIPLDSGDAFDKPLIPRNKYRIILAINSRNTDFDAKHTRRSSAEITIK